MVSLSWALRLLVRNHAKKIYNSLFIWKQFDKRVARYIEEHLQQNEIHSTIVNSRFIAEVI